MDHYSIASDEPSPTINAIPVVMIPPTTTTLTHFLRATGFARIYQQQQPDLSNAAVVFYLSGQMEPQLSAKRFRQLLTELLTEHHDWHQLVLHESNVRGSHWDSPAAIDLYSEREELVVKELSSDLPYALLVRRYPTSNEHENGRKVVLRGERKLFSHQTAEKGIPFSWYLLTVIVTLVILLLIHQWQKAYEQPNNQHQLRHPGTNANTNTNNTNNLNAAQSTNELVRPMLVTDVSLTQGR